MKRTKLQLSVFALLLAALGCGNGGTSGRQDARDDGDGSSTADGTVEEAGDGEDGNDSEDSSDSEGSLSALSGSILDTPDTSVMFTGRDMEQTADTSAASQIDLVSGQDVRITMEGVYVLGGSAENVTIFVEADADAEVQLVLDGVTVTNTDAPVVHVKSADKVYLTTVGDNHMQVSGAFAADGETNLDAVIFSQEDLVINGTGTLQIDSSRGNGITSKDDLKVTGGTVLVNAALDGLEANDSIRIAGGVLTIDSGKDGLHAENTDDDSLGYIYMRGGALEIAAAEDGVQGTSVVQFDGGSIDITQSGEGVEATYVQINDGEIRVKATDDGINAAAKSTAYSVVIEVNAGTIHVEVEGRDVDGFDANGDLIINGGSVSVVCPTQPPSGAFDFDGTGELNGGTITVNGEVITELAAEGGGPGRP